MLIGLLKRFSRRADLLREDGSEYQVKIENDYEHDQEHE
jgi:hypothetical protein